MEDSSDNDSSSDDNHEMSSAEMISKEMSSIGYEMHNHKKINFDKDEAIRSVSAIEHALYPEFTDYKFFGGVNFMNEIGEVIYEFNPTHEVDLDRTTYTINSNEQIIGIYGTLDFDPKMWLMNFGFLLKRID